MSMKETINLDDFKLENVLDKDYKPAGLVKEPEVIAVVPPADPAPEPVKPVEKEPKKEVKTPKADLENPSNVPDDMDEEEIPREIPETGDNPEIDLKPFYQLFHQKLGWEMDDEHMPENSVDGLVEYMGSLIEENSRPKYSDEIVEKFDSYIANGGDPEKFFNTMYASKDYEKVDLESDSDKKQILKEHLSKVSPDKDSAWIEKKIARYEDSGVLDDEAADALEELKLMQSKERSQLVAQQESENRRQIEEYNHQLKDLEQTLLNKKDIAGIPISKTEAKNFYEFLTKVDREGKTDYQKSIEQNKEASYTMAFLAFKKYDVKNLASSVKSDLAKELKQSLSKFSSSAAGLQNKTGIPIQSNKPNYKDFDIGT